MFTIAISNEKGGVAKTTTTVSLGASLSESGSRVLLVDLDAQANLSLALGLDPASVQISVSKVLLDSLPVSRAIVKTGLPGLDVLPSNSEMGMAERFLSIRSKYEYLLRQALQEVQHDYQFVLLDCPPSLGAVTMNAMVAADMLLIPTQPEYFSIYALRNLMNWVRKVRAEYNSRLLYRLVLTMYDKRNKTHRVLGEQLRTTFSTGVLETFIQTDTKLRESPIAGLPIIYHAPKSRAALQYRALAQEILVYAQKTTLQPA